MNRYHKKRRHNPIGIAISIVTICTLALMIWQSDVLNADDQGNKIDTAQYKILRDSFLTRGPGAQIKSPIGRLSLLNVENDAEKPVRFDHSFRSNDKFRIRVSTDRDGYLYILHQSPGGKSQVLWPQKLTDDRGQLSIQGEIRRGEYRDIPPEPGIFKFDSETGKEDFIVILASNPEPSSVLSDDGDDQDPTVVPPELPQTSGEEPIIEVFVRGKQGTAKKRGVFYDPGTKDSDPYIYFSAKPGDNAEFLKCKFTLNHY